MRALRRYRFLVALIAGFGTFMTLATLLSHGAHCRDGWASPSIGHRGACSWHGGVARDGGGILYIIAGSFVAWLAYGLLDQRHEPPTLQRRDSQTGADSISEGADPSTSDSVKPSARPPYRKRRSIQRNAKVRCPKCGSPMVLRQAKRGANTGHWFYGCATYPACRGTRS